MKPCAVWSCCWALLAGAGCDSLGRAVVDQQSPASDLEPDDCFKSAACKPPPAIAPAPELRIDAGSLPRCSLESADEAFNEAARSVELRDCQFELAAELPMRMRLAGARLSNVAIRLAGPVRLELTEDSSLSLVRITMEAADPGSPSLLLEDTSATHFAAESAEELAGELEIARTSLADVLLAAEQIELETVTLQRGALQAGRVNAIAALLADSRLAAQHLTLSASRVVRTTLTRACDTLLVAGGEITESRFEGCRETSRLHDVLISRSALDGPLEAEMTTILDSALGLAVPTRLWAWETSVVTSAFCAFSEQARFASVSLECARCEGPLAAAGADVCYQPDTRVSAAPNACPAFDALVACTGGFPPRSWPQ